MERISIPGFYTPDPDPEERPVADPSKSYDEGQSPDGGQVQQGSLMIPVLGEIGELEE